MSDITYQKIKEIGPKSRCLFYDFVGPDTLATSCRKEANHVILKWISLAFSAIIFIGLTTGISFHKFDPYNFCLMNAQDNFCTSVETNCFDAVFLREW